MPHTNRAKIDITLIYKVTRKTHLNIESQEVINQRGTTVSCLVCGIGIKTEFFRDISFPTPLQLTISIVIQFRRHECRITPLPRPIPLGEGLDGGIKFLPPLEGRLGWGLLLKCQRSSFLSAKPNFYSKSFITNKIAKVSLCLNVETKTLRFMVVASQPLIFYNLRRM